LWLKFEENFAMKTFPFEGGEILMMPVPAPLQDTHKQQTQQQIKIWKTQLMPSGRTRKPSRKHNNI
jgi:hypothetical protein